MLTVICGRVSGELDRVVSRAEDGGLVIVHEARIDSLRESTRAAQIKSHSADDMGSGPFSVAQIETNSAAATPRSCPCR